MDSALPAFALGVWFGITMPLVIHVGVVVLEQLRKGRTPEQTRLSWFLRFLVAPVVMLGLIGVATTFGSHVKTNNDFIGYGLFVALALYAFTAWLYHRTQRSSGADT